MEVKNAIESLNVIATKLHADNFEAGWWTTEELDAVKRGGKQGIMLIATKLCLVHSEVSEALEGIRKGLQDDHLPNRAMFEVEIADTFIRLFDLAGATGIDLAGAVAEKLEYNKKRQDHKKENREGAGGKVI